MTKLVENFPISGDISTNDRFMATDNAVTRILILGGGFAGVQVLTKLQHAFENDASIDITLVSSDNFFLFTPMLPEVAVGMIETRHIATPIRALCKKQTKFYEANIESIDLNSKQVVLTHAIGSKNASPTGWQSHRCNCHKIKYDYLILALGSETTFFGNTGLANNALTIKSLDDAIIIRNHILSVLEQADLEYENKELQKSLMTFVVVGGGFAGTETAGQLNDFVHDSIKDYYHNIESKDARIILVDAHERILPEVSEDLAELALQKLRESGVEVMLNVRLSGATPESVKLDDDNVISSHTLIWGGGVKPDKLITNLPSCRHDKDGRIIVNHYLEVMGHNRVFALGDCACVTDPNTGKPYPPMAQHGIRQGELVARNLFSLINRRKGGDRGDVERAFFDSKVPIDYKPKMVMAQIGKRNCVGILLRFKVHGFTAWLLWRMYYLAKLPTKEKKLRVLLDWATDIVLSKKRDMTRLNTFTETDEKKLENSQL
jgi:NADH:ubiquinone reductase (H+-translocating)